MDMSSSRSLHLVTCEGVKTILRVSAVEVLKLTNCSHLFSLLGHCLLSASLSGGDVIWLVHGCRLGTVSTPTRLRCDQPNHVLDSLD
jgi:hypothetical protein